MNLYTREMIEKRAMTKGRLKQKKKEADAQSHVKSDENESVIHVKGVSITSDNKRRDIR
jgi:hypothetical protein